MRPVDVCITQLGLRVIKKKKKEFSQNSSISFQSFGRKGIRTRPWYVPHNLPATLLVFMTFQKRFSRVGEDPLAVKDLAVLLGLRPPAMPLPHLPLSRIN